MEIIIPKNQDFYSLFLIHYLLIDKVGKKLAIAV